VVGAVQSRIRWDVTRRLVRLAHERLDPKQVFKRVVQDAAMGGRQRVDHTATEPASSRGRRRVDHTAILVEEPDDHDKRWSP
jgi:hypothetical protein